VVVLPVRLRSGACSARGRVDGLTVAAVPRVRRAGLPDVLEEHGARSVEPVRVWRLRATQAESGETVRQMCTCFHSFADHGGGAESEPCTIRGCGCLDFKRRPAPDQRARHQGALARLVVEARRIVDGTEAGTRGRAAALELLRVCLGYAERHGLTA
jgi:hypothetical protein